MARLTEINERGEGIDYYPKDNWPLGFVVGKEHPFYNLVEKLAEYEDLEERLRNVYGECDGLLQKVVEHLESHEGIDLQGPVSKARLLTDDDVDRWEELNGLWERQREVWEIIEKVLEERKRQDAKWGEQNHTAPVWGMIIGEEYGEMCHAINEFGFDPTPEIEERIYTEAIHAMASCMAMLECMERMGEKEE